MNDFRVLPYEEESKLNVNEKIDYYKELKEYLKQTCTSNKDVIRLKIYDVLNKKIVRSIINKVKGYELIITGKDNIPNGPVIYTSTHQDMNDHFNIVLSIPEHAIILNTNTVTNFFKLIMGINGIVYVDRTSKEDRFKSKIELMKYLSIGKSIVIFPEGTYNCSPNKLHLPLHSGVIDIAKKMNVPIVPVTQEYIYDENILDGKNRVNSCHVHFSKPIYVNIEDSTKTKKQELSSSFATARYMLMENKGKFYRKNVSNEEYINYVKSRINTWKMINVDYNEERKTIYGYNDELYLFYPINDLPFNEKNELLETEHVRYLNDVYQRTLHKS